MSFENSNVTPPQPQEVAPNNVEAQNKVMPEQQQETPAPKVSPENIKSAEVRQQEDKERIQELREQSGIKENSGSIPKEENKIPASSKKVKLPPIPKNPYEILGVRPGASKGEITSAFRKRALEYHPDKHGNDPASHEWFIAIQRAREEILGQKNKSEEIPRRQQTPEESFEQKERAFWRTQIQGGYERVWKENSTFWTQNERTMGTRVESQIVTRDGLTIKRVKGIYEREYLVDTTTKQPISEEYKKIFLRDELILAERPGLEYLLSKGGRQLSEGFLKIEKRGNNIIGWTDSFGRKVDAITPISAYSNL